MATETAPPINGNYASQHSYNPAGHSNATHAPNHAAVMNGNGSGHGNAAADNHSSSGNGDSNGVSKDEVGWYFVEQYYTTLSRNPEKLHLFYSKRSQFVSGVEAEKVSVSVGQRAINERIKELDIQDCKVRVSNVDSQESFKNIVVQVIGEMSNKAAPHRKFVQTFVLAEQPNGYFVLNDIFRYIAEEEEDEIEGQMMPEHEGVSESVIEPQLKSLPSSGDVNELEQDAEIVDKKLEESVADPAAEDTTSEDESNGQPTVDAEQDEVVADAVKDTSVEASSVAQDEAPKVVAAEETEQETLKEPVPTPVDSSPTPPKTVSKVQPPAALPKPAAPAVPKTWASMVAANRLPSVAVASTASSNSSAPPQPKATPPAAPLVVVAPSAPVVEEVVNPAQQSPSEEWQTAGQDNSKKQGRQHSGSFSNGADRTNVLGYVKNVTERVDAALLKSTLTQYGKLAYFDVSRPKNCAFVEFADAAGYNAAVAANPHSIGGEQIYVEERRPRGNAYGGGFNNRGGMRGGRGGMEGRPPSQGRGGGFPKDGGRGGFIPRGRGGSMTPRGRGVPQAA